MHIQTGLTAVWVLSGTFSGLAGELSDKWSNFLFLVTVRNTNINSSFHLTTRHKFILCRTIWLLHFSHEPVSASEDPKGVTGRTGASMWLICFTKTGRSSNGHDKVATKTWTTVLFVQSVSRAKVFEISQHTLKFYLLQLTMEGCNKPQLNNCYSPPSCWGW